MRLSTLIGGSLLSLALPFVASAQPAAHGGHAHAHRRHNEVAHRARGDVSHHFQKRFSGIRFTFYDVGLGACGQYNQPNDFIVALSAVNWGEGYPGPNCFKSITISYKGKTAQATIMDECMGCPDHGLDFSRGLFNYFASESEGVINGDWWFNDGSGGGGGAPPPPPTTSEPPPPPPTTTKKPPKPTTSSPPPPPPPPTTTSSSEPPPPPPTTSSSSWSETSWSSSTESSTSTSRTTSSHTPSSSASPTPTSSSVAPTPTGPETLEHLNQAVLGLAALAVIGGEVAADVQV